MKTNHYIALASFAGLSFGQSLLEERSIQASYTYEPVFNLDPTFTPENMHLRRNKQILVTSLTAPKILQLDPLSGPTQPAHVVHTFSNFESVTGIIELHQDVFVVTVGNFTVAGGPVPGSWSLYEIDLRGYQAPLYDARSPKVKKLFSATNASFLNGLALINARNGLLAAADPTNGTIWLLDIYKREMTPLATDTLLQGIRGTSNPYDGTGVNGAKFRDNKVYFTNSGKGVFGYIPVDPLTGHATGSPTPVFNYGIHLDDFNFSNSGNVYLTTFDTQDGGILRRTAKTPAGKNGTEMIISRYATNSIVFDDLGYECRMYFSAGLPMQIERAVSLGPC